MRTIFTLSALLLSSLAELRAADLTDHA